MLTSKLSVSLIASICLFFSSLSVYAIGDSCLQMYQAHWHGEYAWTFRGNDYKIDAVASTNRSGSYHHYIMTMQIQTTHVTTLQFHGVCMNSQIYFEDLSTRSPIYLSGTINENNDGQIELTGQRGPDVLSITLKNNFN